MKIVHCRGAVPVIFFRRGLCKRCATEIVMFSFKLNNQLKCIQYFEPFIFEQAGKKEGAVSES